MTSLEESFINIVHKRDIRVDTSVTNASEEIKGLESHLSWLRQKQAKQAVADSSYCGLFPEKSQVSSPRNVSEIRHFGSPRKNKKANHVS